MRGKYALRTTPPAYWNLKDIFMSKFVCTGFSALMLAFAGCADTGSDADCSGVKSMGAIAGTGDRANEGQRSLYLLQ
ncbi:hypothetical protein D3C72_2110860 [compost metagenome]